MKSVIKSLAVALLLANVNAIHVRKEKISNESKDIINSAVNDVLKITQAPEPTDTVT